LSPKGSRTSSRSPALSSPAIAGWIGIPTAVACGSRTDGDTVNNLRSQPCADAIGEARSDVGLVDHDGDLALAGGQIRRECDVATEADHDIGVEPIEDCPGLAYGMVQLAGCAKQFAAEPS
jgi:hypothetical protein